MREDKKCFLDSNILIYLYSNSDDYKRHIAGTIVEDENTVISTQVLQEITNVLRKKYGLDYPVIRQTLVECTFGVSELHTNTVATILSACEVAQRYGYSFYDSLVIAAALESNCAVLYSEDLQHNQIIEQKLIIKNPFISHL